MLGEVPDKWGEPPPRRTFLFTAILGSKRAGGVNRVPW